MDKVLFSSSQTWVGLVLCSLSSFGAEQGIASEEEAVRSHLKLGRSHWVNTALQRDAEGKWGDIL